MGARKSSHWISNRPGWDLAVFSALALLHFLAFARFLNYPDLIYDYPFSVGDSQDWIANGLYLAGRDVSFTARPPLLPLVIASLDNFSLLSTYPLLVLFLTHSTICGLYGLLRLDYSRTIAGIVAAAWLVNTTWLKLSLPIAADVPAACLLFWSIFFWRRKAYAWSGLLGGLSAITQPLALLLAAPVLATLIIFRRRDLTSRPFLLGGLLFVAPTFSWLVYKKHMVGRLGDGPLRHWSLLTPHLDSLGFYAYAIVAFVGPIAMIGILLGSLSFVRRASGDPWRFFVLCALSSILGFFVLLYDFNSLRFLVYIYPLSAILLAEGMQRWVRPGRRVILGTVLIWAMLPAPGPRADPTRIALWPLPPTYLKATDRPAGAGSRSIDVFDVEIEVRPSSDWLRYHPYRIVSSQYRRPRIPRGFDPESVRNDSWAVHFYDDLSRAGAGYSYTTRTGNLLYKRVHDLPASAFAPAWERLVFQQLGKLDGQTVFRARIPSIRASWVVLTDTDGRAEKKIQSAGSATRQVDPDLGMARTLAPHLRDRSVAILAPENGIEPWQTYLAFVADMRQFVVTEHRNEVGTRKMMGPGREIAEWDFSTLREHLVFGRPWLVIEKPKGEKNQDDSTDSAEARNSNLP